MSDEKNTSDVACEHGPAQAAYNFGDPTIVCLCGWVSRGHRNWEGAGADFDSHLDDVEEDRP